MGYCIGLTDQVRKDCIGWRLFVNGVYSYLGGNSSIRACVSTMARCGCDMKDVS